MMPISPFRRLATSLGTLTVAAAIAALLGSCGGKQVGDDTMDTVPPDVSDEMLDEIAAVEPPSPTRRPYLWLVESDPPAFLFGTIHVPDERVLALPDVVIAALEAADVIYTEIPMDQATQTAAATRMMRSDGSTLKEELAPELYARCGAYVSARGLSLEMFGTFKTYAIATQLVMLDYLPKLMAGAQPLDAMLASEATERGQDTDAIETVDEQIAVFEALTVPEQALLLEQTLDYLEAEGEISALEKLVRLYLHGDVDVLGTYMNEYMMEHGELATKLEKLLLTDRNHLMAERIDALLDEDGDTVRFFAIGAGHYAGETGLTRLLAGKGYKIRRLTVDDAAEIPERLKDAS